MCVCSDAMETVIHSADAFAPVGYLRFTKMHTESKDSVSKTSEAIHKWNLFYRLDQCCSMLNQSFYSKSLSCWRVDYLKSPLRGNKYENKTFWCLITLSSRRDTQHCRAGFRSTSRGPPSLSLASAVALLLSVSSLHPTPLAPHGLLWRLQYSLQPETRPSLINMSTHIKALCIQVSG